MDECLVDGERVVPQPGGFYGGGSPRTWSGFQGNAREQRLVMDEGYIELVLSTVEQIPRGQVASYGDIAELVGVAGPRLVGRVSLHGSGVPWWRVVRADGRPVRGLEEQALELLRRDGTPLRDGRVDMRAARMSARRPIRTPDCTRWRSAPAKG